MAEPSELARVPAALDAQAKEGWHGADAARLLREMAADFAHFTSNDEVHWSSTIDRSSGTCGSVGAYGPCDCGLDAARAKWRLTK